MEKQEENSTKAISWGLPLPLHVALVIFSKLSISNLPACRSVSKSWNRLVLDYATSYPKPFRKAIIFSTVDCNPFIGVFGGPIYGFRNPKIHCFDIDTLSFVASCTLGPDVDNITIYDCCNGLLFIDKGDNDIECEGIFNPMTREFFQIPSHGELHYTLFHGFGFSPKTKQYKLFRAESGCNIEILRFGRNNNKWTCVSLPSPITLESHGVYMDGVIYWIGKEKENEYVIYALDVETEKFEVIAVLEVGPYCHRAILQPFYDTISAIVFVTKPCQVQVWRMREKDSWVIDCIIPGEYRDVEIDLIKASEDGNIFLRIMNNLFWLNKFGKKNETNNFLQTINNLFCFDKSGKKKIKTLIPYDRQFSNLSTSFIEYLHFGSLPDILAGDD